MKDLPLPDVYKLLEPGPVILLTTERRGRHNIMTMSWHMMVDFTPPLIACVVSNGDYSFAALRATKECVIAIPDVSLAEKVVKIGNCSGSDVDKFAKFALTPARGESRRTVDRGMIRQSRMPRDRYAIREQIRNFHSRSCQSLAKSRKNPCQDHSSSGLWHFCSRWRNNPSPI
jgi:Flavin reductase like domain